MKSPFIYGKIATGDTFTDREQEQKRLSDNITSGISSILISPRRWGKSSLVVKVGDLLQKKDPTLRFCYLDLFNVRTEQEFYAYCAKEVLRVSYSRWEDRIESAKRFFQRAIPKFSMGVDPVNDLSISFDWEEVKRSAEEILNLPERVSIDKNIRIVLCVDEFQNVGYFDDPAAFQKKLRAQWQHHTHATYCLYGSKRHLMTELFENTSMPFYRFGDVIFLEKIPDSYWVPFIVSGFKRTGKSIAEELALQIAGTMEDHPYYVQQFSNAVWRQTGKRCTQREVDTALDSLLTDHAIMFQREIDGLTNPQISFLQALCDKVVQLSSAETLAAYHLGTSGNVNRMKSALVNKEILDITPRSIEFIDPLFKMWFKKVYLNR